MRFVFDGESFGKAIKTKRVIDLDLDIRTAAKKIGVSPATLSRCENGRMPELLTFFRLCRWVCRPVDNFVLLDFKPKSKSKKK